MAALPSPVPRNGLELLTLQERLDGIEFSIYMIFHGFLELEVENECGLIQL